jgi:hypothetical protein
MSNRVISYHPRLDATPEAELEVLARVYSFLMQRHVNRKAAASGGCADNKGGESDQSNAPSGSGDPSATDRRGDGSDKRSKPTKEVIIE